MIRESGRIVAIEPDGLWVETVQRTACGNCAAKTGCGTGTLAKWMASANHVRVLLDGRDPASFRIDQTVTVGVPEDILARSSLIVYLLPMFLLIAGMLAGQELGGSEGYAILGSLAGLLVGGLLVRWHAWWARHDARLHPVLLDD